MAIDYNTYRKMSNSINATSREQQFINEMVRNYNKSLTTTISDFTLLIGSDRAQEVEVNGVMTRVLVDYFQKPVAYKVLATDSKAIQQSIKIWAHRNVIKDGDLITVRNTEDSSIINYYLVIEIDDGANLRDYDECYCQKCNYILKYKRKNGDVISTPCFINKFGRTNDAFKVTKESSLPDDSVEMYIRNYENTNWFNKESGFRFMLGSRSAYTIVHVDDATKKGLLYVILKETSLKDADDRLNEIADNTDYYNSLEPSTGGDFSF